MPGFREPKTLDMFLGKSHGSIKADDGEVARYVQDGLNDRFAHLGFGIIKLCGIIPGHISTVVAVINITISMTQPETASQEQVLRGAYCARAGDCIGCHTAQKGQPFAGGAPFTIPVGKVYSTNITPDSVTGIGRYDKNDFVKVMREGIAKDGHHLFPAMPYPSYARVSQEDLAALHAWFMHGLEPVHKPNRPTKLSWPLSVRSPETLP